MALRLGSASAALLGVGALTVVLAIEAGRTAREHERTAERVIGDYAALGAEGVATRLQGFLASRLYPILGAVSDRPPSSGLALASGLGPAAAALAAGVAWVGRLPANGPLIVTRYQAGPMVDPGLAGAIATARAMLPPSAYFGSVRSGDDLVVFASRAGTLGTAMYGLRLTALAEAVDRFLADDLVLPEALTHGARVGDRVGVRVTVAGREVGRRGELTAGRFHAAQSLGPMFGNLAVAVQLADALAPSLLIGGLPPSRLPLLLGILGLTLALMLAAGHQVRQQERLARLREDFVAGASHELRTPLAQIRLFAETLRLERVRNDEERANALSVIEREARRLEHLVENLLHFSRSERGTLQVAPEAIDLSRVTREIVADFGPLAEKAGVAIRVGGAEGVIGVVDPAAWRQIVLNLLDNAVKYGGPGQVTVDVRPADRNAELAVTDQGPGVVAADREKIWARFERGDAAGAAGIAGTGIGLATVRDLVTLHGGSAWVEDGVPRGARFVVRLPGAP